MSHGQLGNELLKVAEMMFGQLEKAVAVSLSPNDSVDGFGERVGEALALMGSGQTLIMADLFGGTPANAAARLVKAGSCHLVAGVNLPMLLEILGARGSCSLEKLTELASAAGLAGITTLTQI